MSNISIHLTNLTPKDAQFITGVIALFADPRNDEQSDLVRSGQQLLYYTPTGRCLLVDPDADRPTRSDPSDPSDSIPEGPPSPGEPFHSKPNRKPHP